MSNDVPTIQGVTFTQNSVSYSPKYTFYYTHSSFLVFGDHEIKYILNNFERNRKYKGKYLHGFTC